MTTKYTMDVTVGGMSHHPQIGWFLHLQELFQSILVGNEKPEFNKGDKVKITIEKA